MRVVNTCSIRRKQNLSRRHRVLNPLPLDHELRLRRWAREHYVPAAERSSLWHPAILDEMATREAELVAVLTVENAYRRAA